MSKNYFILFLFLSFCFIGCSDDNESINVKQYTVYSHLDSGEPLILNRIADLSSYIDLDIDVEDSDIAKPLYDWEGEGFIVTPLKEGKTIVTVREKGKLKYKIEVIVEYAGVGNWNIENSKITIQSDADIKDIIEQDLLNNSIFYDEEAKSFYDRLSFENNIARLAGNAKDRYLNYDFIKETQEYAFVERESNEKQLYKFSLQFKSDVGVMPQHKIGIYSIDRTSEYQTKYPTKSITKVLEEYKVECYYNNIK